MNPLPDDELLSAYLDDELSAEERARAERLLVERPEARRLLDELRGVRESLQSLPSYRLEPDFNAAVLRRAEREVLRPATPSSIVPAGDASPESSRPTPRWQRPVMWSLLAVAAAVALMFVDRRAADDQHLAQNKRPEQAARPEIADPAAGRRLGEADLKDFAERKRADGLMRADPPATPAPMRTENFATQPTADAPQVDGLAAGRAAGPAAKALGKVAASTEPAPPAAHYSVVNSGVPAVAGNPNVPPLNQLVVPNPQQPGGGGTAGGFGLGQLNAPAELSATQTLNPQIDTTPLVAVSDFNRAQTIVAELRDARRGATNEQEALRALSLRGAQQLQVQPADREAQQRWLAQNDQLLIVTCDVPRDALERGLAPVLQRQQIADLTALRWQTQQLQFGALEKQEESARAPARDRDGEMTGEEEYVYVVADGKQLEATLAALRDQPDYFFNVTVEPAPANERQQAWRSSYSRGIGLADSKPPAASVSSPVAAKAGAMALPKVAAAGSSIAAPLPVAAPSSGFLPSAGSLPSAAATSPVPAAPPAGEIAKKTDESLADRKNQTGQAGKVGASSSVERNAGAAKAGPTSQPMNEQLGVNGTSPGGYSYVQNAVPMSRAQRLRSVDANYAVENRFETEARRGGEKAQEKPAEPAATAAAPAVAGRPQPAKPDDSTKSKDESGAAPATQQRAGVDKLAEQSALGNAAQLPAPTTFGYELPPDYHEALFIFRVVAAPPAKPQSSGGDALKGKAQ